MLGLIYILLSIGIGWVICLYAFPNLADLAGVDCYKRRLELSPVLLLIPAWFISGVLAMTWLVYIFAYLFRGASSPLFYANLLVMPIAALIFILTLVRRVYAKRRANQAAFGKDGSLVLLCGSRRVLCLELLLFGAVILLACILMWRTFFVSDGKLHVGLTVFSDFSPHIGMIRSFSYGNNFPTSYSHYAGEDIRYHFMFQFMVGNLEFLGLRLDYAFNLPSIMCFVVVFMLLYVLALKLTGKQGAGIFACLFFAFRSSKTLYTFLTGIKPHEGIIKTLKENTAFISDTPHEDWGLWNLNVYCNQRHFALGLAVMFFILILYIGHPFDMYQRLKTDSQAGKNKDRSLLTGWLWQGAKALFFSREGWLAADLRTSIAAGILLGSLGFFHGAALIGCILVLFVMAIISSRRLEFLITALITMALSFAQTSFFIDGSAVSFQPFFGFVAENKTLFGVLSYLERLLGVLPAVLLVAFCIENGVGRWMMLAFAAPLLFAFTVSLTVDVTVNHKYIMMSCILLSIYAAGLIMRLLKSGKYMVRALGVLLIFMLTATGVYDFCTVIKRNEPKSAIILDLDSPLTEWIKNNSDSKDIFLTHRYALNQVVLGGAMLYEGWPYFPWSAGYDTDRRERQVIAMYEAKSPEELDRLVKANNIRFIIVDYDNRSSDYYTVNEENIKNSYECVYTEGDGEYKLSIYDADKPINRQ